MLVVIVYAHVKPDFVEAFRQACVENAKNSILELGIARFDVIQQSDDITRFVLVEVYRSEEDPPHHRETAHYRAWKDAVDPMMAEPRTKATYHSIYPDDTGWSSVR